MPYKAKEDRRRYQALYKREHQKKDRKKIIQLLGGVCNYCGFEDERALCIDHIKAGGTQERLKFGGNFYRKVRELVESGSRDYQILCANCNQIKKVERNEVKRKY